MRRRHRHHRHNNNNDNNDNNDNNNDNYFMDCTKVHQVSAAVKKCVVSRCQCRKSYGLAACCVIGVVD
jgi:hypothetical protein